VAVLALLGYRLIRQISIREELESELREAKDALEALNGTLKTLALHDGLTGLANRRHIAIFQRVPYSFGMRPQRPACSIIEATRAGLSPAGYRLFQLAQMPVNTFHTTIFLIRGKAKSTLHPSTAPSS
jgi:hypothetical protein